MYKLNPDQQKIIETVRKVADEAIAPRAADTDRDAVFPRESLNALAAAGLFGLTVPREFGGMGEGLRTMTAVLDEIAQRCASTAMVYKMHLCGIACYAAK